MSWTVRCNLDSVNLQVKYGAFEKCRSGPWVHLKHIGSMHCIPWHALDQEYCKTPGCQRPGQKPMADQLCCAQYSICSAVGATWCMPSLVACADSALPASCTSRSASLALELSSLLGHAAPTGCLQVSELSFELGSLLGHKTYTVCLQRGDISHKVHACKSMSSAKLCSLPGLSTSCLSVGQRA